jgi:hypothetical protein
MIGDPDMTLRRRQPFNRLMFVGLMFLAVANVVRLVVERHTSMPEGPRDGLFGLLFGLAIGCLVLGIRRMRSAPPSDGQRCV